HPRRRPAPYYACRPVCRPAQRQYRTAHRQGPVPPGAREERRHHQAGHGLDPPGAGNRARRKTPQRAGGAKHADDRRRRRRGRPRHPEYRAGAVWRVQAQARVLLRLQPHPRQPLRPARAGAAPVAGASPVSGRFPVARLRLSRRRIVPGLGRPAAGHRSQAGLGAGAPRALSAGPEPRAATAGGARARHRHTQRPAPGRTAPSARRALSRPGAPALPHAKAAALRRGARLPAPAGRPHFGTTAPCAQPRPGTVVAAMSHAVQRRLVVTPTYAGWRTQALCALAAQWPPETLAWEDAPDRPQAAQMALDYAAPGDEADAPCSGVPLPPPAVRVSRELAQLLREAAQFRSPRPWALLYRVLWRYTHGDRAGVSAADEDGARLHAMAKAVRRDHHDMIAYVRFRRGDRPGMPQYVAWYEPRHDVLADAADHFARRMGRATWCIGTPHGLAHWDGRTLHMTDAPAGAQ